MLLVLFLFKVLYLYCLIYMAALAHAACAVLIQGLIFILSYLRL